MSDTKGFSDPKILLPFLLITLIWGSTWIVIKDQLGSVPPVWSVSYRFIIAGAVMFLLARIAGARFGIGRDLTPFESCMTFDTEAPSTAATVSPIPVSTAPTGTSAIRIS